MYYPPRPMGKGKGPMGGRPFPPQQPKGGFPMMPKGGKGMPFPPRGPMPMRGPAPFGRFAGMPPQQPPQPFGLQFPTVEAVFPFLQRERKLPELCKRQPRLYYSQDMIQEICHWVDNPQAQEIPLETVTSFNVEADKSVMLPAGYDKEKADDDTATDKYTARVMLLSPLKTDEKKHKMQKIRFILAQDAKGHLVPYGGEWIPKDGKDPTKDSALIATAIRHTKALCGLDLSRCKKWIKFTEAQYRRKNGAIDHTVIFVPDVWNGFPEGEEKVDLSKALLKEDKEVEEEVDKEVEEEVEKEVEEEEDDPENEGQKKKVKKTVKELVKKTIKEKVKSTKEVERVVYKPQEVTLQALLDASTVDSGEAAVEAVLFGGAFDEMVSYINAKQILKILRKKKKEADEQSAALKRKREEDQAERQVQMQKQREEFEAKKRKSEEDEQAKKAEKARLEEEEKDMDEEEVKKRKEAREKAEQEEKQKALEEAKAKQEEEKKKREEEAKQKKEEEEAKRKQQEAEDRARGYRIVKQTVTHIDEEIAAPFQYFDKPTGASGQIRKEIIEGLLHGLGELTQREVDALLRAAGVQPDRANSPLLYRRLASYTVTEEKQVELPPEKKEEAKGDEKMAEDGGEGGEAQTGEGEGEGMEEGYGEGEEGAEEAEA